MKKKVTYLFVFVFASLIFYGGAGINVISFCCNDCRSEGISVLLEDQCCEIHGHHHDETASSSHHEREMCCDIHRIYFDWDNIIVTFAPPQPISFDLLLTSLPDISDFSLPSVKETMAYMPSGPPLPPRTYLSLLTTLLI